MRSRRAWPALLIALTAAALCAGPAAALPRTNPANRLAGLPIDPASYEYSRGCRGSVTVGLRRFEQWLNANVLGNSWGTLNRDCRPMPNRHPSLHAEGRAIDWHLDAAVPRQRREADGLIRMLLATDRVGNRNALARRMGVQEIVFNCRRWYADDGTVLKPYEPCARRGISRTAAHRDHIHLALNWRGARALATFWSHRG